MPHASSVHVGQSVQTFLDNIFGYLPNIIGFLVIIAIGYVIARLVKAVLVRVLGKLKVDDALTSSKAGGFVEKISPGGRPSRIVGGVAFWLIFIYAIVAGIGALQIPSVTAFANQVLAYLPNVIAAVLIFVVAAALGTAIAAAVNKTMGDTPTGKLVETIVPGLIMAIAVFMILTQLHIAPVIVTITYTALIGMLALAGALAFGLGGREVAARMWQSAYDNGQRQVDQAKADARTGQARAQEQAGRVAGQETAVYPTGPDATAPSTNQTAPGARRTR
jgi:hypothetical protein